MFAISLIGSGTWSTADGKSAEQAVARYVEDHVNRPTQREGSWGTLSIGGSIDLHEGTFTFLAAPCGDFRTDVVHIQDVEIVTVKTVRPPSHIVVEVI